MKRKIIEKLKNKKVMIIGGIAICLIAVVGITLAFYSTGGTQEYANSFSSGCLNIELTDESSAINLTKAKPITDIEGLQTTSYDFTIKNTCNSTTNYQVNLESLNEAANSLGADYIKVSLSSDTFDNVISILGDNPSVEAKLNGAYESHNLYTGVLNAKEEKTYHLRLWIDYDATASQAASKTYLSKINVIANPDTQVIDTLEAKSSLENTTLTTNLSDNVTSAKYCISKDKVCEPNIEASIAENKYSVDLEETETSQMVCTKLNDTSKVMCSDSLITKAYDFNLLAMYLNKGEETLKTNKIPKLGYTLNKEQSTCKINDKVDENAQIVYENNFLYFNQISESNTKCTVYFDLIPDSENPVINGINSSGDDTSITITINATDNIGIYYYYYKLDNGEEVRSEDPTYKFEGLNKDQTYTISVRVVDAAGNEASATDEVTVGLRAGDVILATSKPQAQTTDWTDGTTYYYTGANPDNWVYFANFYWRIIRINGDGSIRMIYQGTSANTTGTRTRTGTSAFNSSVGNKTYVGLVYDGTSQHGSGQPSTIMTTLNNWYNSNLASYETGYIDTGAGFCSDRNMASGSNFDSNGTIYYAPYKRKSSGSLQCNDLDVLSQDNGKIPNPIGLLTSDEYVLAGSGNSYLDVGISYWTMSPYDFYCTNNCTAYVFYVYSSGFLAGNYVSWTEPGVRPVINLKSAITITGSGTSGDPFKVE